VDFAEAGFAERGNQYAKIKKDSPEPPKAVPNKPSRLEGHCN
jgi:hypothetical protein